MNEQRETENRQDSKDPLHALISGLQSISTQNPTSNQIQFNEPEMTEEAKEPEEDIPEKNTSTVSLDQLTAFAYDALEDIEDFDDDAPSAPAPTADRTDRAAAKRTMPNITMPDVRIPDAPIRPVILSQETNPGQKEPPRAQDDAHTAEFPITEDMIRASESAAASADEDEVYTETFEAVLTPHRHTSRAAAAVAAAVVLLLSGALICTHVLGSTKAVMLCVDGTNVGYIESADAVYAQYDALCEDLQTKTEVPFDAYVDIRTESEKNAAEIAVMSSGEIYDTLLAAATDGYIRGCQITDADGNAVAYAASEGEILSAIEAASSICREALQAHLPDRADVTVTSNITVETSWIPEDALASEGALVSLFVCSTGVHDTDAVWTGAPLLTFTAELRETVSELIPYETTLVPNDENFDGVKTMISPGADGLCEVTYLVTLDPDTGETLSREELSRTVKTEPVNAVSYDGTYPLPDGVSTGTFVWPLPDLPDDDLPLDADGNPYVPENTLALKNTYISSGYGDRMLWGVYDFHLGLDIVAPAYTEIYASDGGVVVYAAYTSSYGYMTRIRHADNVETVYAHQVQQVVKPGDVVAQGQCIGYVGATGTTSGTHLHFEFRRDHVTVDPAEYIEVPDEILVLDE